MAEKFERPPLNELVIATYFNPPLFNLRSEHIGLYWTRIRNAFPSAQQQVPVNAGGDPFSGPDIFPMPRYWFVSSDEVTLLQLQRNALLFNWRKRDSDYPHFFENLKPEFDHHFKTFSSFIRDETDGDGPSIDLCELSYVNAVSECEYWRGPRDTPNIIPSFSLVDARMGKLAAPAFNCNFAYMIDSQLHLNVSIKHVVAASEGTEQRLIFEIKASGRLGGVEKGDADTWFVRAHDAIIEAFVGMTNPEIQTTYWLPKGDSE